jgi:nitrite reductase (NADH) large subunit
VKSDLPHYRQVRFVHSDVTDPAAVQAVGIQPEARLGVDAGLEVSRGIVVDDRMVTSDPAILALTGADAWVENARYELTTYVRGAPEWLHAHVVVLRDDGTERTADLVFLPGEEPTLLAAEGEGIATADDDADDEEEE